MAPVSAWGLSALLVGIVTAGTLLALGRAQRRESAALASARRRAVRLQVRRAEQRLASAWLAPITDATQIVGNAVSASVVRGGRRVWRAALRRTTRALGAPAPTGGRAREGVPETRFGDRLDTAVLQVADDD